MAPFAEESSVFLKKREGVLKFRNRTIFFLVVITSLVLAAILLLSPYFICLEMIALCTLAMGLGIMMADTYIRDGDDAEFDPEFYGHAGHLAINVLFWSNLSVLILILISNILFGTFYRDGYALPMLIWVGVDALAIPLLSGTAGWLFRRRWDLGKTIATVAFVYMTLKILAESILGLIALFGPSCIDIGPLRGAFECPTPPPGVRSPGHDILAVGTVFRVLYCGVLILSCLMIRKYLPLKGYALSIGYLLFISTCAAFVLSFVPLFLFLAFSRDDTICPIFGQGASAFYNWLFSRSSLPTMPSSEYYSSSPAKFLLFLPL